MAKQFFDPVTFAIIGAAMEAHNHLGPSLMEVAYHRALVREFNLRGIPFEHEVEIPLWYKGEPLGTNFRADFRCGDIILEIKAMPAVGQQEYRQLSHYVLNSGARAGLLLNFGAPRLHVERFDQPAPSSIPSILPSQVSHT